MTIPDVQYLQGWKRDPVDERDYTLKTPKVKKLVVKRPKASLPSSVDLRADCGAVYDQGNLGSCSANAGVSLIEYYQKHLFGKYTPGSRLFLYKVTRNLGQRRGDTGAWLRETLGALVLFGVPPEKVWPYDIRLFDEEPSIMGVRETTAFVYCMADDFSATRYVRLDPAGHQKPTVLTDIKTALSMKMTAIFGFDVYQSIYNVGSDGNIPYPASGESIIGGHAVHCVGYDDAHTNKGTANKGAFLIKNSWGTNWGVKGYCWLPYDYLLSGHADDWWTLVTTKWTDVDKFSEANG